MVIMMEKAPARSDAVPAHTRHRWRWARLLAVLGGLTLLGGCRRSEPLSSVAGSCEAETAAPLAAPIYTFDGVPLNLDRESRIRVDRWVAYFHDQRSHRFARFLRRMGRYEAQIRPALRANGLPEDLRFLALIESGMNPNARSRSEAVGLWQFLESTGLVYGLEITRLVDERRRPERATQSAINYLTDLYEQFDDWFLAAAAYNSGPNRVKRAIERSGHRDYWELVRAGQLPRETAEYVPKMLAALWLGQEPGLRGFGLLTRQSAPRVDPVWLYGRNRLSVVASAAGVSEQAVRTLNPWLVQGITPPGRWTEVRLPAGTRDRFEEIYALIPLPVRNGTLTHSVRRGETLATIAQSYGVDLKALQAANPDAETLALREGQKIQVPAEMSELLANGGGSPLLVESAALR